jgi:hypothetical protein
MNILLVINTPGGAREDSGIAVIPADKLLDINLNAIDGKMVNIDVFDAVDDQEQLNEAKKIPANELSVEQILEFALLGYDWEKDITNLYKRLGLETQTGWENDMETKDRKAVPILPTDLAEYMNPEMPVTIHRVVQIGWAM